MQPLRTWRRLSPTAIVLIALAVLNGCASTQSTPNKPWDQHLVSIADLKIDDLTQTRAIAAENIAAQLSACFPSGDAHESQAKKIMADLEKSKQNVMLFGRLDHPQVFYIANMEGFCIQRSQAHWPILSGEMLKATVNPVGISASMANDWYRQIARRLATIGEAKVAYVFPLENRATIVTYWISFGFPRLSINYRTDEKKNGQWEREHLDLIFSDVSLRGINVVRWGNDMAKSNLLGHRLHPAYQ
jgi:hypothetical protein